MNKKKPVQVETLRFFLELPLYRKFNIGKRTTFSGWCFDENEKIDRVILHVDNVPYECTSGIERGEVRSKYDKYNSSSKSGFHVDLFFYKSGWRDIRFEVLLENGHRYSIPCGVIQVKEKKYSPLPSVSNSGGKPETIHTAGAANKMVPEKKAGLPGLNIISYFLYGFGIAESARAFVKQILGKDIPLTIYNIDTALHQKLTEAEFKEFASLLSEKPPFDINFFFITAGEIINHIHRRFPFLFKNKYNVGVFWWEFDDYFDAFKEVFDYIDHVLVFSEFIVKAVAKAAPPGVIITQLPYPFLVNWEIISSRSQVREAYHLKKDDYVFMYNFDFLSTMERKNPEALLKAFSLAFAGNKNVKLLLKTSHSQQSKTKLNKLLSVIDKCAIKPNVLLIHETLTRNEIMSLTNAVNCYVSLHRSEGFGLGMAEAMYLGKPVIATRYGGNLEFMNDDNSFLVNYSMTSLERDALPYRKGWRWANPNIEEAAGFMMKVYEDRNFGNRLGQKAAVSVREYFDEKMFYEKLQSLLNSLPPRSSSDR